MISTGPGAYCLDLLPSMVAVHPWFYTSLLKPAEPQPAGPQPAGPPAGSPEGPTIVILEDNCCRSMNCTARGGKPECATIRVLISIYISSY